MAVDAGLDSPLTNVAAPLLCGHGEMQRASLRESDERGLVGQPRKRANQLIVPDGGRPRKERTVSQADKFGDERKASTAVKKVGAVRKQSKPYKVGADRKQRTVVKACKVGPKRKASKPYKKVSDRKVSKAYKVGEARKAHKQYKVGAERKSRKVAKTYKVGEARKAHKTYKVGAERKSSKSYKVGAQRKSTPRGVERQGGGEKSLLPGLRRRIRRLKHEDASVEIRSVLAKRKRARRARTIDVAATRFAPGTVGDKVVVGDVVDVPSGQRSLGKAAPATLCKRARVVEVGGDQCKVECLRSERTWWCALSALSRTHAGEWKVEEEELGRGERWRAKCS